MTMKPDNPLHFLEVGREDPPTTPAYERSRTMQEISLAYEPQTAKAQADRCLDCGNPYCQWDCPVANHIPQWLKLISEGQIFEAARLSHQTNSLPEICGRICPQDRLCEGACTLNDGFGAVTIGAIEQYITETALARGWRPEKPKSFTGQSVAVIGAGPAGLGCADVLVQNGIRPVVFDKYARIGGLLTFGIPPFKLDKGVVERRRELLQEMGVEFRLGEEIGKNVPFLQLMKDFDAVFVGTGAYTAVDGGLPGRHLPGVIPALPYLIHNVNALLGLDNATPRDLTGKSVVVLGGGDTAMDCVRTSIRLGADSVQCLYRREQKDMPGSRKEVKHAREEGVEFTYQASPTAIERKGEQLVVSAVKTAPGEPDESGRRSHQVVPGSEMTIEADLVIIAFGYRPSPPAFLSEAGVELESDGRVRVGGKGRFPGQTSVDGIFAGGDTVRGADLVVRAVYDGRLAAQGILGQLRKARQSDAA